MLFIGSIRERLAIALSGDEYADALEASASLGIVGGGIYDAMLAHSAISLSLSRQKHSIDAVIRKAPLVRNPVFGTGRVSSGSPFASLEQDCVAFSVSGLLKPIRNFSRGS